MGSGITEAGEQASDVGDGGGNHGHRKKIKIKNENGGESKRFGGQHQTHQHLHHRGPRRR